MFGHAGEEGKVGGEADLRVPRDSQRRRGEKARARWLSLFFFSLHFLFYFPKHFQLENEFKFWIKLNHTAQNKIMASMNARTCY